MPKIIWMLGAGVIGGGAILNPTIGMYDATGLVQIPDGDNTPSTSDGTDYGLSVSLTTVTKTFTLKNSGNGSATGVAVALSGSGSGGFTVTVQPSGTIAAAGSSTFQIRYDALTPIAYTATVTVSGSNFTSQTFTITGSSLYSARILAQSPYDYRQLNEGSGTSLADSSSNAHTAGTGTGITWDAGQSPPMLGSVPYLDGTNDVINIYSAGFATGFNLDEFTISFWAKMQGSGVWTDGTSRFFFNIQRNSNNLVQANRSTTNGELRFTRTGNAAQKQLTLGSQSNTDWVHWLITASMTGGGVLNAAEMKIFKNKSQVGSTLTGLTAAAGSGLDSTRTVIGASITTPASVANAYFRDFSIFAGPATSALITELGSV